MVELSIVIPVYNEENNLHPLHSEITNVVKDIGLSYEIIFIDDGSSDGSFHVLRAIHDVDSCVKVIRFRKNFGQTAAFSAGFDHAMGNVVLTLDSDGQNDPADIPNLLGKLYDGDYDLVIGWRISRKEPFIRRLVSRIANFLISQSTRVHIHDRGCSLKAFKVDLVKSIRLYGQLHRFLPELASSIGARVTEVPVNDRDRKYGEPKYGSLSRTPRVILDLLTVIFILSFFSSPMRLFGSIGLVIGGLGFLVGGGLIGVKIYNGIVSGWAGFHSYEIGNRPLFLLSMLLSLVGVQFLFMGLLGEMVVRTYHEAQGKPIYSIREVIS